jgi:hypothetical protein
MLIDARRIALQPRQPRAASMLPLKSASTPDVE